MNANQIINMIMRMVMRKAINKGLDVGIEKVAGRGKPRDQMTRQERQQANADKQSVKNAQKMMKMTRRLGRM